MAGEIKTEEELYLQNDETFRDEGSDAWKLKGKIRSAETRSFFANIIASMKSAFTLSDKPAISDSDPLADADNFGVQREDGSWWGLSWAKLQELLGATGGQATLEAASNTLAFTNPFGHIRTEALTGAQTFTKSGTTLGTTIVQAYTADGTSTVTFDFAHTILNSDFVSGTALATGEYKLFFSNWGDSVVVSIATVGAGVAPTPNTAPTITLGGANPMTLTVGDTYTEPGATATDSEDGDISASIVITGTVDTATAGTYTRYYNVSDSAGLAAAQVTRTVQVNAANDTTPPAAPDNLLMSSITESSATAGWDAPIDSDVAGYNLYLDGVKQN